MQVFLNSPPPNDGLVFEITEEIRKMRIDPNNCSPLRTLTLTGAEAEALLEFGDKYLPLPKQIAKARRTGR